MSLLKVKRSVRPRNLWIACAVTNAANALGLVVDMLITSGTDGTHMVGSKHYTGDALDIRTSHLSVPDRGRLVTSLRLRLGPDFDVVLEATHLHIEYDKKGTLV